MAFNDKEQEIILHGQKTGKTGAESSRNFLRRIRRYDGLRFQGRGQEGRNHNCGADEKCVR